MSRTVVVRRLAILAVTVLAMLALAAPAAFADTFTVTTTDNPGTIGPCDAADCTLMEAITAANNNGQTDTINFAAGVSGDIELSSTTGGFSILDDTPAEDLTINGPGASVLAVDGNNQTRAFGIAGGAIVTINGLTIKNGNTQSGDNNGGGIINLGTLTLNNSTVSNNTASFAGLGGGIFNAFGATLTLNNSTVSNNTASGNGGGFYNNFGTLTLNNSTVDGNKAGSVGNSGGGIYNGIGTLTLNNSTVSGNQADDSNGTGFGGGIYSHTDLAASKTTVTNSTISGNGAATFGGGIYNIEGLTAIENSTITNNNTAPSGQGGGVSSFGDTKTRTEVLSTIVSANANNDDVDNQSPTNSFQSFGYNLIGGGDATSAFNQPGDRTGVTNPLLGPLANNGGSTLTHALLPGSPAIDAGSNALVPPTTPTDQRGLMRIVDGNNDGVAVVDIGAFELQPLQPSPPPAKHKKKKKKKRHHH